MNKFELRPTPLVVPIEDPFQFDRLERREHAENLTTLLEGFKSPFVLSIDASWGSGKTTFVRMWSEMLRDQEYRVVVFNAWEADFHQDPLVALLAALLNELDVPPSKSEDLRRLGARVFGPGALAVAATWLGLDWFGLAPSVAEAAGTGAATATERAIDAAPAPKALSEIPEEFRQVLKALVAERSGPRPAVFFIDELDRCRPLFAHALLERLKHFFEVEGLVFVLSLHREQLAKTIQTLYGQGFDATGYLRRFFDLEWDLPKPSPREFAESLIRARGWVGEPFARVLAGLALGLGLELRPIERIFARAEVVRAFATGLNEDPVLDAFYALLTVVRVWNRSAFQELDPVRRGPRKSGEDLRRELAQHDPSSWIQARVDDVLAIDEPPRSVRLLVDIALTAFDHSLGRTTPQHAEAVRNLERYRRQKQRIERSLEIRVEEVEARKDWRDRFELVYREVALASQFRRP